jgi:hypothetical protein
MAQQVLIDIPGIGQVEAKNAASEYTLNEILKIMQKFDKSMKGGTKPAGPGGGDAGAGAAAGKGSAATGGAGGGALNKSAGMVGSAARGVGKALGAVTGSIMKLGGPAAMAAGALFDLGKSGFDAVTAISQVGDSLTAAAGVFSSIPVVGGLLSSIFGAVAQAATAVSGSFQDAAKAGASFGGSMTNFKNAASAAGMPMEKFGKFIAANSQGMLALGSTVEEGAKRFGQVSKALRASAGDLYALGYSSDEVNAGIAKYGELMKLQGFRGKLTNDQLAAGAKNYMKEMDQLAKITGEERSAKEAQMKALATDAQFNAAMAGKDEKVRGDFMKLVGGFGPKMGGFVKDFIATGTMTTEANQKIGAMLGGDVMNELQNLRGKMQRNERLTDAEQDRLKVIMKKASDAQMKSSGTALAASRDMDDATGAMVEAQGYATDAHQQSTKEQKDAAKNTDGMNKKIEDAKNRLSEISNEFQMFLASSGILDTMLVMFQKFAGFLQTYMFPIINGLGSILGVLADAATALFKVWMILNYPITLAAKAFTVIYNEVTDLTDALGISFGGLTGVIDYAFDIFQQGTNVLQDVFKWILRFGVDGILAVTDFLQDTFRPAIDFISRMVNSAGDFFKNELLPAAKSVSDWFTKDFIPPIKSALDSIFSVVRPVVDPLVAGFKSLWSALSDAFRSFNTLGEVMTSLKLGFRGFILQLKEMWYAIKDFIPGLKDATPEERKALEEEKAALAVDRKAQDEKLNKNKEENIKKEAETVKKIADERAARDKKLAENRLASDKRLEADRKAGNNYGGGMKGLGGKGGAGSGGSGAGSPTSPGGSSAPSMDYNAGGADLLKQYAAANGSALIKDGAKPNAAGADAARKAAEADAQEKAKLAGMSEQERAEYMRKKSGQSAPTKEEEKKPAQESPETLLANLNTKMDKLITVSTRQFEVAENQLSVQKGMTKNLYRA